MILTALHEFYERLLKEPESNISPPYYSKGKVRAALELAEDGSIIGAVPLGTQKGTRTIPIECDVPERLKRASGVAANFLCDPSNYILGLVENGITDRSLKCFEAAKELHTQILDGVEDAGAQAVLAFFNSWDPQDFANTEWFRPVEEALIEGGNIVFRLQGDYCYVHERPAIRKAWENYKAGAGDDVGKGQCLVTGEIAPVARLHQSIKGIAGAQSSGASLVSYNFNATESYGKKQGANAPVSEKVAFSYGTSLNWLTANDRHQLLMGDTTVVFWAEKSGPEEDLLLDLFADAIDPYAKHDDEGSSDDKESASKVKGILMRLMQGLDVDPQMATFDPDVRFYILGLAPNAARIAIRFWHVDTFGELIEKVRLHFDDMSMVHRENDRPITVGRLLFETAPVASRKREQIPPILSGPLMRAVLEGSLYPQSLYATIIQRIRTDSDDPGKPRFEQKINYPRAAYLKAHLKRKARISGNKAMEEALLPMLNPNNKHQGYLLGRLFALLEKAQQDANPGIKATIKARYYASASATPGSVFPVLLRLAQHHIAKSEYGNYIDRLIQEVVADLDSFSTHLTLDEQGLFALGYYQQKAALYEKAETTSA